MARSKNCLKCYYCRPFEGSSPPKRQWKTHYSCDFALEEGHMEDKGTDPDHCLLFRPKSRRKAKPKLKY